MPLRADEHRPIGELLLGRVEASPRLALTLCIGLAHAFLLLHVEGLCYRDISFGNVFFDPATGTPMICDNDNVGVDGDSFSAVLGTRKFMAPEVIRGEAMPSAQSDLHSLAVLLFYVLARHHPLIGRLESRWRGKTGEEEMLGTHPLFIFDPSDDRNRPDEATQPAPIARWARLPRSLKVLFEQSFTTGLHDPSRRVRESVWRATLTQLLDSLHRCGWCGEENLTEGGASTRCVACRRHLDPPVRLRSERCTLTLNDGTVLTAHHVHHNYDLATGIGRVVHDETRNRWGLRNLSAGAWRLERVGRAPIIVQPGQAASLLRDAELIIDRTRFVFEASR
ncbi:hypothetical protein [Agromyces sp. NPDC049794]|uniref:protein kinase domain-containing protein n=1 Tax=unclassified Agromyces TaxID=2639701 RepID=UPI0033E008F6